MGAVSLRPWRHRQCTHHIGRPELDDDPDKCLSALRIAVKGGYERFDQRFVIDAIDSEHEVIFSTLLPR